MADFLTQEEIDTLLDVVEDEPKDLGSNNFENLYSECSNWIDALDSQNISRVYGSNPQEILENLEQIELKYKKIINEYEKFQEFHKRFLEIAENEPEIFI